MVTFLITLVVTAVVPITSVDLKGNDTFAIDNTVISYCEIGQEYCSTDKNECQTCQNCPKAPHFLSFRIKVSPTYRALECYPCYCKLEKKVFDPDTGRCKRCNECKHIGKLNKTVAIPEDRYKGGLNCYGNKSQLIIVVNLIICIFICGGVFYTSYKRKQLPCKRNADSPSVLTPNATMSVRSLDKDFQTVTSEPDSAAHLLYTCSLRKNSLQECGKNGDQQQLLTSPGNCKIIVVTNINQADSVQIGNGNNYNCNELLPS